MKRHNFDPKHPMSKGTLLKVLAEQHRPIKVPDECAYTSIGQPRQYRAQCPACDGNRWQLWRHGDPDNECHYWKNALALGIVKE